MTEPDETTSSITAFRISGDRLGQESIRRKRSWSKSLLHRAAPPLAPPFSQFCVLLAELKLLRLPVGVFDRLAQLGRKYQDRLFSRVFPHFLRFRAPRCRCLRHHLLHDPLALIPRGGSAPRSSRGNAARPPEEGCPATLTRRRPDTGRQVWTSGFGPPPARLRPCPGWENDGHDSCGVSHARLAGLLRNCRGLSAP